MVCFKNVRKKTKNNNKKFRYIKEKYGNLDVSCGFPDQFGNNILIFKTCNAHTTSIKYLIYYALYTSFVDLHVPVFLVKHTHL